MERLIDDVLIMDFNRVLAQQNVNEFMNTFKQFTLELENPSIDLSGESFVANFEKVVNKAEIYTYESEDFVKNFLTNHGVAHKNFRKVDMGLEDAFIGLTGKY